MEGTPEEGEGLVDGKAVTDGSAPGPKIVPFSTLVGGVVIVGLLVAVLGHVTAAAKVLVILTVLVVAIAVAWARHRLSRAPRRIETGGSLPTRPLTALARDAPPVPPATVIAATRDPAPTSSAQATLSGPTPLSSRDKVLIAGGLVTRYLIGGVLALTAVIGGNVLHDHFQGPAVLCNAASQVGAVSGTGQIADCSLDTTLATLGVWMERVGVVVLVVGAIAFVVMLFATPLILQQQRQRGK